MKERATSTVHWSFWMVGTVGLIFNLGGCMNYLMQMNAEMVAAMPDVYRAMVEIRPAWGTAAFAIAVFGGALGCVLLLLRKSISIYAFIASLLATVVAQIPFVGTVDLPIEAWFGWFSQFVVGAFLIGYSKWSTSKDWVGLDRSLS